jgi:glycogen debranching enzyme
MINLHCAFGQSLNVGLLIPDGIKTSDAETDAAFEFMIRIPEINPVKIELNRVTSSEDLKEFQVLWMHHNDSVSFSPSKQLVKILKKYIESGGNILLTLEAFRYISHLKPEPFPVETRNKPVKDDGYGRQLGLHSFRSHPVFAGLNGGAYIFKPGNDTTVRIHGYFEDRIPINGEVVAVDWDYIFLRENSKLMLEYRLGKGNILAVGGYVALSQPNKNRQHLELFLNNCLNYLANPGSKIPVHHWQYDSQSVSEHDQEYDGNIEMVSDEWKPDQAVLSLKKDKGNKGYLEVAGERMLIMAKENGGIDEVWSHPFMALRDYQTGIKFQSADSIIWLNDYEPKIEVCPEAFIRTYSLPSGNIMETVFVSQTEPVGVVHYDYEGNEPADFFVKFKSNMRLMWPYSEKVFQSLEYSHQLSLNAILIYESSGDFSTLVGANKEPQSVLAGQYEDFSINWEKENMESPCQITGISSDKFEAGGIFHFRLMPGDRFDVVFTAENTQDKSSASKAIRHYQKAVNHTFNLFDETRHYYSDLFNQSLMIETPDKTFNEGYKWVLVSTDRFFIRTPEIGGSLVAGYNTTNTGWDGEHKIDGRPGYAWYFGRDGQWSGFALLGYGDFEKVKSILEMYIKFQDLNGKIYHEVSTSGVVHYDAADATPLFIILAGKYLKHSGDIEFIRSNWEAIKKAVDFCFSIDTDADHLIENTNVGHGWVEGGSLFGTHSSLYLISCWADALENAGYMANALELHSLAKDYLVEALIVKKIINSDFWNQEKNYFYQGKYTDGTFMDAQSIMQSIPMYFGQVPTEKADFILPVFAGNNFSSDWGCRIIGENNPNYNPRGYHSGSVWPLFSGWVSLAEYNHGNSVQAYTHLMNSLQVYKHWGLGYIEEVMNGETYQPSGVCRHQCWSETMVLQPAIEGMLGLKTDALNNVLKLSPNFPADWDSFEARNIRLGEHLVHFTMNRKDNLVTYNFKHSGPSSLKLSFTPNFPTGTKVEKIATSYNTVQDELSGNPSRSIILDKDFSITYHTRYGISVLPVVPSPQPGDKSSGIRIISDQLEGEVYTVVVEALYGSKHEFEVYIQDWKLKRIENANIISSDGKLLKLETDFPSSNQKYVEKKIKIFLAD